MKVKHPIVQEAEEGVQIPAAAEAVERIPVRAVVAAEQVVHPTMAEGEGVRNPAVAGVACLEAQAEVRPIVLVEEGAVRSLVEEEAVAYFEEQVEVHPMKPRVEGERSLVEEEEVACLAACSEVWEEGVISFRRCGGL